MLLPFQLYEQLSWITIPATIAASYIILGILFIGREIENPFGNDVNDLPLETYCEQIASEMDVIAAQAMELEDMMSQYESFENRVLFPVSSAPYKSWMQRSEQRLREAIKSKPVATFRARRASVAAPETMRGSVDQSV
jgi:putative membrane protein